MYQTSVGPVTASTDTESLSSLYVLSLSGHWSAGAWFSVYSSSYANIDLAVNPAPAVEYNYFDYAESTRKQLRFLYRIGYTFSRYHEVTIYDKMQESILTQTLSVTLEVKQPWGNVSSSLSGSTFLTDFSKNRLELWAGLSLHVIRGLAIDVSGRYSRIHDQISLPKSAASEEDILLGLSIKNHVIATGGSAVYSDRAMTHLKSEGVLIFLDVDLATLMLRVRDFSTRGLARRPDQSFASLFDERLVLYTKHADIAIKCDGITQEQVCERIIEEVRDKS